METHESVDAMVASYAEKAVAAGRAYSSKLNYSEESIQTVETILAQVSQALPGTGSPEELSESCKMWGSYLGEVLRRRFGGEWSIETYPGRQFATLTLNIQGSRIFPSMKVHRRLTQGENENVWSFYKMIKAKLESAPGGNIQ